MHNRLPARQRVLQEETLMYVVRNWLNGETVFACTDYERARQVTGPCGHRVWPDLNGGHMYWWWKPRRLGEQHPYDVEVHEELQRELVKLIAAYKAGCNA